MVSVHTGYWSSVHITLSKVIYLVILLSGSKLLNRCVLTVIVLTCFFYKGRSVLLSLFPDWHIWDFQRIPRRKDFNPPRIIAILSDKYCEIREKIMFTRQYYSEVRTQKQLIWSMNIIHILWIT